MVVAAEQRRREEDLRALKGRQRAAVNLEIKVVAEGTRTEPDDPDGKMQARVVGGGGDALRVGCSECH